MAKIIIRDRPLRRRPSDLLPVQAAIVHYILFKGQPTHNAPIVTNKEILTKHLKEMKAVLVQG
ncbi:MAG: hypothetical protein EBS05_11250 [Proteobacteria bacterium]|nr:hypothetical protein [Pseudomonadota bacterium]